MKIIVVQDSDWLIRGPHQQHHLMEKLALRGHEIRVIDYEILWKTRGRKQLCSRRQVFENTSKIYDNANVLLIRPGIIKIPFLDYVSLVFGHKREIEQQIKEFQPNLIVGLGILSSYLAAKAAVRFSIPFVYYWIDVLHTLVPFKLLQPIAKALEIRTLKKSDKVLVINEKLRNCVLGLGADDERIRVVKSGVDTEKFRPSSKAGDIVRKKYGLKKDDIVLFYMGWLYNFSGLKEVAIKLATVKDGKLKLLIVGEGNAYKELKQVQQKYDLQDRLILTGQKPYTEMPAFISAASICLLPAYPREKVMQDIVPIKLYEYMTMKKPVIVTRLPGVMKEFGEDNGVVYVDNPVDVIDKAKSLVEDGKIEKLGDKARKFVQKYRWDSITDEFEKILEEVVRR